MLTFLFWNSKAASAQLVAELVHEHEVDVLMLVETKLDDASVVGAIRNLDGAAFSSDALPTGFKLYTRFDAKGVVTPEQDMDSMTMRRIRTQQGDVLLVIAHLRSKSSTSNEGQAALVPIYTYEISRIEDKIGDKKTILVGDLNMDPFEPGVVGMTGFHAIPNHRIATERGRPGHKGEREVEGRYFPFFYNPMWNFFGDERNGPGGTFFRDKSDPISYFWHMFDQVLIRPALVPQFKHKDLKILTRTRSTSLLARDGKPDNENASDHLPILFRLDLDPIGVAP